MFVKTVESQRIVCLGDYAAHLFDTSETYTND
jgi:hypothetical protein